MKNKFLLKAAAIVYFLIAFTGNLHAAEEGDNLNSVMKTMLWVTVALILIVLWLAVIYSEKNDADGKEFLKPFNAFLSWLNQAKPLEEEEDIMFHHDFDGIRELDNKVPPWFQFLFYGTIIWSIGYLFYFHILGTGQVQEEEYLSEIQQARLEREILIRTGAFLNEESVTFTDEAAALKSGEEIYLKNCASCHGQNGGGLVGPNLTDEYWINGGGIKNIFVTVKYGVNNTAMQSWQALLSPKEMQDVGSYILTMENVPPPAGKAPEGNKWNPDAGSGTDSTGTATDSDNAAS